MTPFSASLNLNKTYRTDRAANDPQSGRPCAAVAAKGALMGFIDTFVVAGLAGHAFAETGSDGRGQHHPTPTRLVQHLHWDAAGCGSLGQCLRDEGTLDARADNYPAQDVIDEHAIQAAWSLGPQCGQANASDDRVPLGNRAAPGLSFCRFEGGARKAWLGRRWSEEPDGLLTASCDASFLSAEAGSRVNGASVRALPRPRSLLCRPCFHTEIAHGGGAFLDEDGGVLGRRKHLVR